MGVMGMNVLQASYALQYPPTPLPPPPTPAKSMPTTPKSPPQRRLAAFTPTVRDIFLWANPLCLFFVHPAVISSAPKGVLFKSIRVFATLNTVTDTALLHSKLYTSGQFICVLDFVVPWLSLPGL